MPLILKLSAGVGDFLPKVVAEAVATSNKLGLFVEIELNDVRMLIGPDDDAANLATRLAEAQKNGSTFVSSKSMSRIPKAPVTSPIAPWRPIATEPPPSFSRIIVSGWQKPSASGTRGYWYWTEDMSDEAGLPVSRPLAEYWQPAPETKMLPDKPSE